MTDLSATAPALKLADPLPLAQALIRAPSVTPKNAGVFETLEAALNPLGFVCTRYRFGEVENLYARRGRSGPNLCFAGHLDVVPEGRAEAWTHAPFEGAVAEDLLWGRGAADMKSAVAAFVAAVETTLAQGDIPGSLSLLITGDEEGPAVDGTKPLLAAIHDEGERLDHVIVGEPTSQSALGDVVKVGRRGSLNTLARAVGRQGHVAYPERAANPVPALLAYLSRVTGRRLDDGTDRFQPSNLEVTTVDVGNPTTNVIPAEASARFNIRFNVAHKGDDLKAWLETERAAVAQDFPGVTLSIEPVVTGEAFLTEDARFIGVLQDAVEGETGRRPTLSTGGGTSDARFIKDYAPVAELGLVGTTMHQVDERVPVADVRALAGVYARAMALYGERFGGGRDVR